ncbi:hypothetical protein [Psychromarinibacter halotolerans]|uniref:Uncharacterized protein n=1 Tax=Psychromarinibacter halotolerans TaxID=1775175 RepID=A0ABV7GT78_9RHOB|nr:hypothetical protein [Psychromarinibacter halotolerans]MDF0594624.1 hypothetical protein [Psychromarinibacter halotolerans]
MGRQELITIDPKTGVPRATAHRLTRSFLARHGTGLDDLLRRFPTGPGPALRAAIERCLAPGGAEPELQIALDEACDTLLSLRAEEIHLSPADADKRLNIDAGLRWYAARLCDLAKAARRM